MREDPINIVLARSFFLLGSESEPRGRSRSFSKFWSRRRIGGVKSHELELLNMAIGTVKWFNGQKGFGFIAPNDGGSDVFVHATAVERAGMAPLHEGQKLSYELERDDRSGKLSAGQLQGA
jgi:CspA family cold shock protein